MRTLPDEPTERPIIFNAESVRAILAGSKTQTRRPLKPQPHAGVRYRPGGGAVEDGHGRPIRPKYGVPPDRLWVKEAFGAMFKPSETNNGVVYRADYLRPCQLDSTLYDEKSYWTSPLLMPRKFSRLTLEITDVRVQRLREISDWQILAEGMPAVSMPAGCPLGVAWFKQAWDAINGERAPWDSNPWVWAITFKVVR